jgi:hypothetical protein
MAEEFPIIVVPEAAYELSKTETMGTKYKFWFDDPNLGPCLYKQSRPNTGEDWAEKIAAELCKLLGLPHAQYELATWKSQRGTVSPSFLPDGVSFSPGNQFNEFLSASARHRVNIVLKAIADNSVKLPLDWVPPVGIETAVETFVGYLLLDAWIGNTDRHSDNWGVLKKPESDPTLNIARYLAPTHDHASSLGVRISDEERQKRLITKDTGYSVQAYAKRCSSQLYASDNRPKPLKTFEAFREAALYYPQAAEIWLNCLAKISANDTLAIFNRIPRVRISQITIDFSQQILKYNRERLLELTGDLL